ncbi:MAG: RNA methyltransferase [Longimicrobiales bacterium]
MAKLTSNGRHGGEEIRGAPGLGGRTLAERFVIVLNETQDLVNIAGSVRAMLNTGLWRQRLVRPALFDAYRIAGIAHGSERLLDEIEFFDTLGDAIADASHIVGTTARRRAATYIWQHPRQAAPELLAWPASREAPLALVFGREDAGLSNAELDLCDRLLVVPVDPRHPSLNLAQAVLLIGYELWLAALEREPVLPRPKRTAAAVTPAQLRALFDDTRRALDTIEFFKAREPESILRTLRAVFRRANLSAREAKLVRAVFIEVRKFFGRQG